MPKPKKNKRRKNTPFSKATEESADISSEAVVFSFKYLKQKHSKFLYEGKGLFFEVNGETERYFYYKNQRIQTNK